MGVSIASCAEKHIRNDYAYMKTNVVTNAMSRQQSEYKRGSAIYSAVSKDIYYTIKEYFKG